MDRGGRELRVADFAGTNVYISNDMNSQAEAGLLRWATFIDAFRGLNLGMVACKREKAGPKCRTTAVTRFSWSEMVVSWAMRIGRCIGPARRYAMTSPCAATVRFPGRKRGRDRRGDRRLLGLPLLVQFNANATIMDRKRQFLMSVLRCSRACSKARFIDFLDQAKSTYRIALASSDFSNAAWHLLLVWQDDKRSAIMHFCGRCVPTRRTLRDSRRRARRRCRCRRGRTVTRGQSSRPRRYASRRLRRPT